MSSRTVCYKSWTRVIAHCCDNCVKQTKNMRHVRVFSTMGALQRRPLLTAAFNSVKSSRTPLSLPMGTSSTMARNAASTYRMMTNDHGGDQSNPSISNVVQLRLSEKPREKGDVINNLLYSAGIPEELDEDAEGQLLSVLVEDEPGVLSRVSSLLSGRGYNIRSLSVSPTDVQGLSRMTITVMATSKQVSNCVRQIEDVEEVLVVLRSNRADSVHREVILLKMATQPPADISEEASMLYVYDISRVLARYMQLESLIHAIAFHGCASCAHANLRHDGG
eukprot:m.1022780 g.1022780  ORF g.1022780 m.1022780 type:complete len:278 (-) comp24096_c1_seq8:1268-2101(-)